MKRNVVFMFNVTIENSKLAGDRWLSKRKDAIILQIPTSQAIIFKVN